MDSDGVRDYGSCKLVCLFDEKTAAEDTRSHLCNYGGNLYYYLWMFCRGHDPSVCYFCGGRSYYGIIG